MVDPVRERVKSQPSSYKATSSYYITTTAKFEALRSTFLRIPNNNDAKIAKISNLWTFWPVIQLINHFFKKIVYYLKNKLQV